MAQADAGSGAAEGAPETSREIVLVGDVDARAAADLAACAAALRSESAATIVIDMSAVRTCHAGGLEVLLALHAGEAGVELVIQGARWSQFFDLLLGTPLDETARLCHQVRQLVWSARRTRHLMVA